jgi:uncharacterized membrane protein YfcA
MRFWLWVLVRFCVIDFLSQYLHDPVIMIPGVFVAGMTPEAGGAVAFPALSLFFEVDRALARDLSLMIQSIGMTSASVYVLTHPQTGRRSFRVLTWLVPICCAGFVAGLCLLESLAEHLIYTIFLSLITAFAISYAMSERRGGEAVPAVVAPMDRVLAGGTALIGCLAASLFGTGADVLLYTLIVARFRLQEKIATRVSLVLMTSVSFCFRLPSFCGCRSAVESVSSVVV